MPLLFLRYESWTVRVTSADPDDLAWLSEFLACGFEETSGPGYDADVRLDVDADAYHSLLRVGPADGEPVEGFARDSRPSLLLPWRSPGTFQAPRLPGFYRVSSDGRAVSVLVPQRTPRARLALMRVVRELTMDQVVATGGLLVHGAAVAYGDDVVVMAGPKGRGKTTLLLSLLLTTGARYVCNDRCVARLGETGVTARGLPTLVSLRRDGLAGFPALRRRLLAERPELAPALDPSAPGARGASLTPPEACRLLGCGTASGGRLAAVLFPRVGADTTRPALTRLSESAAVAALRDGLFRAGHATVLGGVFGSAPDRAKAPWEVAAPTAHAVVARVPCARCELPAGSVPDAPACADLVARALGR
jgi:hypothetical protein